MSNVLVRIPGRPTPRSATHERTAGRIRSAVALRHRRPWRSSTLVPVGWCGDCEEAGRIDADTDYRVEAKVDWDFHDGPQVLEVRCPRCRADQDYLRRDVDEYLRSAREVRV